MANNTKPKVQLTQISKCFETQAVDEVNLSVQEGEVVTLVGPSGSGKSTLLRIIAGLEKPDSGDLFIDDKPLSRGDSATDFFGKVGLVFQGFNLFPNLSVLNNLVTPMSVVLKVSKNEAQVKAKSLLGDVGLNDKYFTMPAKLSGGQKQRIAIARMLAMEPEIILFDEPTSALDPEWSAEMLELIRRLVSKLRLTTVVVTHEIAFAKRISDRIVFLENGRVIDKGRYSDIIKNNRVSKFINKLN